MPLFLFLFFSYLFYRIIPNMKKTITRCVGIASILFLTNPFIQAQVNEGDLPNMGKEIAVPENAKAIKTEALKNKSTETLWFDYIDDARNFGEQYTYFYGSQLWPDSMPIKQFDDGPSHNGNYGSGMVFDPASGVWTANPTGTSWTRHTRYTVDSLLILYKYHNYGKERDSVVITLSTPENIDRLSFNNGASPTSSVDYDPKTNKVIHPDQSLTFYLDSTNNTPSAFGSDYATFIQAGFEIPVGIDVVPASGDPLYGNLFAVTVQFFPHRNATLGEELKFRDSLDLDSNNLPLFSTLTMRGNNFTMSDPAHNFGLFLYRNQRYSTRESEWFYPSNSPSAQRLYTYTLFKITGKNVGINELNNVVSFALSPNPINRNALLFADFKLNKPSNVRIAINDLQGRELMEVANNYFVPGEHLKDANISNLAAGTYIYSIKTDFGSTTKKFVVY
ncbi:MAG: hypothetical protein RLZZ337_1050 [Bacteroidota bacterium]|jgi:hypothetical protein